ncbi:mitochondrial ribonuclease P protein 1 homolog [Bradysia coprophila]|uniref:mitochondrial ribonuclease P protein 1 homolog n=1 Tax=Bradysia coprophila TaxID=38358 RepID=UPI00187DAEC7|nr:mitochondrial ribonuclease P protein 1 homolog [Bradysia coprophila]
MRLCVRLDNKMFKIIKHCCLLTQNFCSHYQSSALDNVVIRMLPRKFDVFRLNSTSSRPENELTNTLAEEDQRMKLIKIEIDLIREKGGSAPDINFIQKHHWNELLLLKTKTARQHYYKHLFSIEQTRLKRKLQTKEREQRLALKPSQPMGKVTFLLRIERKTINSWRNNRLFRAMQHGEKLIFDCSYDEHMTVIEAKNAANQLTMSFSDNRRDREPFDLHFCNVNFNSVTMKHMERNLPTMRNQEFPMNLHECSYADVFPREQLLYLTPHCDDDLTEYDPNMIYIVGAMVDKRVQSPLSVGKVRELNLKMARLPLNRYLKWGEGFRKFLTLDQMVRIMLDLKRTGKWEIALQHVPKATLK